VKSPHTIKKEVFKMKQKYFEIGNKLITNLGLENKTVIKYWKAYEKNNFFVCWLISKVA
jgi:hypothetical protein